MNETTINRIRLLLAVALIGGAAVLAGRTEAAGGRPGDAGAGELYRRTADGFEPLPMLEIDISIEVTGIVSHGVVEQRFHNPEKEAVDAIYVFPLPEKAAVHGMEIDLGDRIIRSVVREREAARREFEEARAAGKKAALLEQEKPNLFVTSVAGIEPDREIVVRFEYVGEVSYADGRFSLAFPLTFTPRYRPGSHREAPPFVEAHHRAAPTVIFHASIDAGIPLRRVWCDSHALSVARSGVRWDLRMEASLLLADRDVLIRWEAARSEQAEASLMVEERPEGNYALILIVPPIPEFATRNGMWTETLFVVDVSGSMDGPSIAQAREALLAAVERLRPGDRFNILKFNEASALFRPEFVVARRETVSEARGWIEGLEADGGTEIYPALFRAVSLFGARRDGFVQRIIFLTDGAVGNEPEMLERIARGLGAVRLHALGIGNAPNRYLMREMAAGGRGICSFIATVDEAENKIDRFFSRLDRPVMTDLELQWNGAEPDEVYPARLADLHAGEPLCLSASFPPGQLPRSVTLRGETALGEVRAQLDRNRSGSAGRGIATRWAWARVDHLMSRICRGEEESVIRPAVLEVGLTHHLVTPYTSFVAVEERVTVKDGRRTVEVANALPRGSRLGAGPGLPRGGTSDRLARLLAAALGAAGLAGLLLSRRGGAR